MSNTVSLPYKMFCYMTTTDRFYAAATTLQELSSKSTEAALFAMAAKDMAHACGMDEWPRKGFEPRFFFAVDFSSGDFVPCAAFKQENNGDTFIVSTEDCLNSKWAHMVYKADHGEPYYSCGECGDTEIGFGHFKKYEVIKVK